MRKIHGPKTIDIAVTEFEGAKLHEPIEPFEPTIVAYRANGREGALPYHADLAGTLLGGSALKSLEHDPELQLILTDYVAACAWASGWRYLRTRTDVARSPRRLPHLGTMPPELRPDTTQCIEAGTQGLEEVRDKLLVLLRAAEDDSIADMALVSSEESTARRTSALLGESALWLACAETARQLHNKPELSCEAVQTELKAAAVELSPQVRDFANRIGILPEFRALAESDSPLSIFFRTDRKLPAGIKQVIAAARNTTMVRFPQIP